MVKAVKSNEEYGPILVNEILVYIFRSEVILSFYEEISMLILQMLFF